MKNEFDNKTKIINLLIDSGFELTNKNDVYSFYSKDNTSLYFYISEFKMCVRFDDDEERYYFFKEEDLFYIILGYIAELYYIPNHKFPLKSLIE